MGTGDHVNGGDGTYPSSGRCSGIYGGLYGSALAANDRCDQASVDLFETHELNVCRLDHGIGGLDHRHEAHTFDHSESFHIFLLLLFPEDRY